MDLLNLSRREKVVVFFALAVFATVVAQVFIPQESTGVNNGNITGNGLTNGVGLVDIVDNSGGGFVVDKVVETGDMVKVHYKGTLSDGSVFDSSEGRDPLQFEAGAGQMIKGFDVAVMGMKEGESKTINLPPEDAYGEADQNKVLTFSKSQLKDTNSVEVGQALFAQFESGMARGTVTAVDDVNVTVDFNHELAGKTLTFELTLVEIEKK